MTAYPKTTIQAGDTSFEFGYFYGGKCIAEIKREGKESRFLAHKDGPFGGYEVVAADEMTVIFDVSGDEYVLPNGNFDCQKIADKLKNL